MELAVYGYGGHAREVASQIGKKIEFYVDDKYANHTAKPISSFNPETHQMMVAIGDSRSRFDVVQKLPKETVYFTYIHPTALILDNNIEIGIGSFIGAYSILTTNIKLGKHSLLNRGNHIGHDTVIGDYFSAMPGSIVSGNCRIGDKVYIGTNSSIREKITITNNVIIGLNSGVIHDIKESGTYAGLPIKKII